MLSVLGKRGDSFPHFVVLPQPPQRPHLCLYGGAFKPLYVLHCSEPASSLAQSHCFCAVSGLRLVMPVCRRLGGSLSRYTELFIAVSLHVLPLRGELKASSSTWLKLHWMHSKPFGNEYSGLTASSRRGRGQLVKGKGITEKGEKIPMADIARSWGAQPASGGTS